MNNTEKWNSDEENQAKKRTAIKKTLIREQICYMRVNDEEQSRDEGNHRYIFNK
jgi:hypothetical protein